jgi:hypothetical protein
MTATSVAPPADESGDTAAFRVLSTRLLKLAQLKRLGQAIDESCPDCGGSGRVAGFVLVYGQAQPYTFRCLCQEPSH